MLNAKRLRTLIAALCMLGQTSLAGAAMAADAYPTRPIRLVVGFSAGGSTDGIARLVAQHMSEQLGQPMVVDNRPGAGGGIALDQVAKASPDGYTLLLITASSTTLGLVRKVSFNIEKDFAPIALIAIGPQILAVNADLPVKTVAELLAYARKDPGKLTYGTSGAGTPSHLAGVMLDQIGGVTTTHIPYKGSSENIIGTAAGNVSMSYSDAISVMPMMQSGKVRALGVTTAQRASFLPSVPTLDESGLKGLVVPLWFGISAPAGTPQPIIDKLSAALEKTMGAPDIKQQLNAVGVDPQYGAPAAFKTFIHEEVAKNAGLIKASGMAME